MKNYLRQIIRNVILEDNHEDYLKKMISQEDLYDDPNLKILLRHNITPIVSGGESSFLGKGAFTNVYEVLYKGKRCVAKVTAYNNDVTAYKDLEYFKSDIPQQYQKHVMKVFDIIDDEKTGYHIIITEMLEELNINLKSLILPTGNMKSNKTFNLNILKKELQNKFNDNKFVDTVVNKISDLTKEYFSRNRRSYDGWSSYIKTVLQDHIEAEEQDLDQIKDSIDFISIHKFPAFYTNYSSNYDKKIYDKQLENIGSAELKSFLEFLDWLVDHKNFRWKDLHTANYMQRANGDIVLSDPGSF